LLIERCALLGRECLLLRELLAQLRSLVGCLLKRLLDGGALFEHTLLRVRQQRQCNAKHQRKERQQQRPARDLDRQHARAQGIGVSARVGLLGLIDRLHLGARA